MSYGLQIMNDAGTILINESLSNFELYETGFRQFPARAIPNPNDPTSGEPTPNYSHLIEIWVSNSISPVIFWNSPVPVTLFGYRTIESNIVFQIAASREFSDASGQQLQYYVFGRPRQTIDQAYGLVVRDEEQRVVFNSNRKSMRLLSVHPTNLENGQIGGFANGRKYATGLFQNTTWTEWRRRAGSLNIYNQMYYHTYVNQAADGFLWRSLRSHLRYTGQNIGGDRPKQPYPPNVSALALIDVTGF